MRWVQFKYDPSVHKSIKGTKTYNSKAALLPMFFHCYPKKRLTYSQELDLITATIYAELALKKIKKLK